ncbi:sensor histidine kinase [Streptomyces sp. NRRL S-340]|uniref:sensor histidine kinase n=1 Tax=Streptomyces sp. NRRL S-340 TaxID=1463901 RepID=UPI000569D07E|nr:HAMP domain-containing sensor histidine kinase [Streptomyces sp. NRRL S-340]
MRGDIPLRRSLRARLLGLSALVSLCSIAATAWLVASLTAVAIGREHGQVLADDARIYDTLVGYAATHTDWDGAGQTVHALARQTGRRITLTDQDRRVLADSGDGTRRAAGSLPTTASATVDPLAVDSALAPRRDGARSDGIDPRAVGPFRLPGKEKAELDAVADRVAACVRSTGRLSGVEITRQPNGRPEVEFDGQALETGDRCASSGLHRLTPTESKALTQLGRLVNDCLTGRHAPRIQLAADLAWAPSTRRGAPDSRAVTTCLTTARREQLAPYVASPVLLFATAPDQKIATFFDLSGANRTRISGAAVAVLLVTVTVTFVAGTRMVRPLRALTGAAQRMAEGDQNARVEVSGGDEFGRLAAAFNLMASRRQQLEEMRRALVSDVAHELRGPLGNVRGWLEAVEDGVVPADESVVSSLLEEAMLLQHIIDDLRDLAAADAGALRLHPEDVDAAALLAQVARAHRAGAAAAGVDLRVRAGQVPALYADPVRLRQAVGNLVSNAVRHTPAGGTVTLSAEVEGDEAVFAVEDTGSGIGAEELPKVFDRFWRADKSRSRQSGGSGLGLSIVRKLAEAHGGTANATSVPGAGSVFSLRLPAGPRGAGGRDG